MIKDGIDSDHVAAICQQLGSSSKTAQALDTDKHAPRMTSIYIEKA